MNMTFLMQAVPIIHSAVSRGSNRRPAWLRLPLALLAAAFVIVNAQTAGAAARVASVSGNWSETATWGGSDVPVAGDTVTVNADVTVTVDATAACASIAFLAANPINGLVINGTQSLAVSGAITTVVPAADNRYTRLDVGAGSLSAASIALAGAASALRYTELTLSSGSVDVAGSITSAGIGSRVVFTGPGRVYVASAFLATAATLTAGTGTVIYDGGAQTVGKYVYHNLTLSGSGLKTTTAPITVNGILSMEGTATASAVPTYGSAASLQYNTATPRTAGVEWPAAFAAAGGVVITNTGTITLGAAKVFNASVPLAIRAGATLATGNFSLTLGGAFLKEGTLNAGSSPIVITGAMAAQPIDPFTTLGLVSMTKASGVASLTGPVQGGALTINGAGGTLNLGTGFVHVFSGALTLTAGALNAGSSHLKIGGNATGIGVVFTAGSGTVEWTASGPQTLAGVTYNNLILSGSGVKTLPQGVAVTGNLSVDPAGTATIGVGSGLNLSVNSLTLGGLGRAPGVWGSSASPATYKNDTYFDMVAGCLTVILDTRIPTTVTEWPSVGSIVYGQMLAAVPLAGGSASMPGHFGFAQPALIPNSGVAGQTLTFFPPDITTHGTVSQTTDVTVASRPVLLTGARPYDGTTVASYDILKVANKVGADAVSVASGSATLAGGDEGTWAPITALGDLALGNNSLGNYTLTGASGSVAIGAVGSVTQYYHVAAGNPLAASPFDTWENAAADIQTAVDKASADLVPDFRASVVLVTNGTYTLTSQILITNGITLKSVNGREVTFVNGNYPAATNRCLMIRDSASLATIDGFSFTNGYAYLQPMGGGIYVATSAVAILNCEVSGNRSASSASGNGSGGGIGVYNSTNYLIANCLISGNTNVNPSSGSGAGLYLLYSKGLMTDCTVVSNAQYGGEGNGAGIYVRANNGTDNVISNCLFAYNSSKGDDGGGGYFYGATVTYCSFLNNRARTGGGGVTLYGTGANRLLNSLITENVAEGGSGGGISINRGSVYNCVIVSNTAVSGGGFMSSEGDLVNCLIAANQSSGDGGGVYWNSGKSASYQMINCTVVRNLAGGNGGGLFTVNPYANVFVNSIVLENSAAASGDLAFVNPSNFLNSCSPTLPAGVDGNITADPHFADAGAGWGTNAFLGDYRIMAGSPAIDSGRTAGAPAYDLNRLFRPLDGNGDGVAAHDMGAYEAPDATGDVLRCSFSVLTNNALESLNAAFTGYTAGSNTNGLHYRWSFGDGVTSDWSAATREVSHLYGYGSFQVTLTVSNELGETASYSRPAFINVYPTSVHVSPVGGHVAPYGNWTTAATNLQAAVDVAAWGVGSTLEVLVSNGIYVVGSPLSFSNGVAMRSVNGSAVTSISGDGTTRCVVMPKGSVLDGFTVSNGYISVGTTLMGAGISVSGGTVRNCTITENRLLVTGGAAEYGAGLYANASLVSNCVISLNTGTGSSNSKGGGLYAVGYSLVANCQIVSNSMRNGAGIALASYAVCRDSVIAYNWTPASGGGAGAHTLDGSLENCLVIGNESGAGVGGIYCTRETDYIRNCTVVGNKAATAGSGGGISLTTGTYIPYSVNTIVWGNMAGGVSNDFAGSTNKVSYTCARELAAGLSGNLNSDPQFMSWSPANGYGLAHSRGDYRLRAGSPCLDAGTAGSGVPARDLDGVRRPQDGNGDGLAVYDLGAYERTSGKGALILIR